MTLRRLVLPASCAFALALAACGGQRAAPTADPTVADTTTTTPRIVPTATVKKQAPLLPASLVCNNPGSVSVAYSAPTKCTMLPHDDNGYERSFGAGSDMRQLKWTGWGRLRATATGCDRGFHADSDCVPVTVTVSKLVNGFYEHLVERTSTGSASYTPDLPGVTNPPPPGGDTDSTPAAPTEPACESRTFSPQGDCTSDPDYLARCRELYQRYEDFQGSPEGSSAIQKYASMDCDQQ